MEKQTVSLDFDPVDLLGRSVHDEKVLAYLQFHDAVKPLPMGRSEDYGGYGENGFCLSALQVEHYRRCIGEPRSLIKNTEKEMIVERIDFSDAGYTLQDSKSYPHPLPFGLSFGDSADDVA